jgi:hypothetical protein
VGQRVGRRRLAGWISALIIVQVRERERERSSEFVKL